ncbi:LTA synthase family protein [Paraglaciecola sp.]|uniref:LTA synthase family protein n=1 Tax=Paraglaciecola sp. TaxID=1920173 RepID=UPI0030F3CF3C
MLLTCSRIALIAWQYERINDFSVVATILLNGLRIDLCTLAYWMIIPILCLPLFRLMKRPAGWNLFLNVWFMLGIATLLLLELVTPTFINEYGLRPNRLFVEYLIYPQEVLSMLLNGHLLSVVLCIGALIGLVYIMQKLLKKCILPCGKTNTSCIPSTLICSVLLLLSCFGLARGTLSHRPINPALVYFSTDPLLNSLTLNSWYSVMFALKQLGDEEDSASIYGKMLEPEILRRVRETTGLAEQRFDSPDLPTLALKTASYIGPKKNLVIVLEESLGAQFVGSLGGKNLTPQLDRIMADGWTFSQLYATGTRSVRGIEAVVAGFTPTPARAVVKLNKSQQNFFTLAALLKQHHYQTQFVYGGESHFDNMKSFFLGNGFAQIVDMPDFAKVNFAGSWGASDQDLFTQADLELSRLAQSEQPFFSLIFSSSNHDPFDIPEGVINELHDEEPRERAIRYADHALGEFINKAKQSNYWHNTVFLLVADHDARVFGSELVPVKNFHIPGVILGAGIEAKMDNRLASQIDLAPTVLSLMGINAANPMLGIDLTQSLIPSRAMMQYDKNFAYMTADKVVILQPDKAPAFYHYNLSSKRLEPAQSDVELGKTALAHALFGSVAYQQGWYTLAQ